MNRFRIALCQLPVGPERRGNLRAAEAMIWEAKHKEVDLVVLPEMFACPYQQERFPEYAETVDGEIAQLLCAWARTGAFYLVGGSFPERAMDGRLYNTCLVVDPHGRIVANHRKVHLFDVELSQGVFFQESAVLSAGNALTTIQMGRVKAGIGICYDLRFPEYSRLLTLDGAEILIFPGAFNPVTGPAHWELLLRARAVDNQAFVVGVSPAPVAGLSYQAYGHSMAVDPWGNVLLDAGKEPAIHIVELDFELLEKVRDELPVLRHRRADLYSITSRSEEDV